jgi:prepilin-type N-terminal cleavage/methylation domain-containing protein
MGKRPLKIQGFTLVELLVCVSIFSAIAMTLGILTNSFVDIYVKSRDQSDLQRASSGLIKELSDGNMEFFDGLKNMVQIVEASETQMAFVPLFKETSMPIGKYADNFNDIMKTSQMENGPPRIEGKVQGGFRIQFNPQRQLYELRYYLAKHPRAGISTPLVYLQRNKTEEQIAKEKAANGGVEIPSESELEQIPVQFKWQPPTGNSSDGKPQSYLIFTGGYQPLEFEGSQALPPNEVTVREQFLNNTGQMFPDPFNRPEDILIVYYQPEIEPSLISGQESMIGRLMIKDPKLNTTHLSYFNDVTDPVKKNRLIDFYTERAKNYSLLFYYDETLTILPDKETLINSNTAGDSLMFPTDESLWEQRGYNPCSFSYYSTRNSSNPLELVATPDSGLSVNPSQLQNISLIRLDLLMTLATGYDGNTYNTLDLNNVSMRNFSHIIPLDTARYTTTLHTRASSFDDLGFRKCSFGTDADSRCHVITNYFPSGKDIAKSNTFFLSNITHDPDDGDRPSGTVSILITSKTQMGYVVRINFTNSTVKVIKKDRITDVDSSYIEPAVVEFPLDNSQLIDLTNLQPSGFLDEDFNYTSPMVHEQHFTSTDKDMELMIEISPSSNIEGFSLTYFPR